MNSTQSPTQVEEPTAGRGHSKLSARGFTLVELLVVIAIIGVLLSIIMPSVSALRRQAKLVRCIQNEKTLYTTCFMFANDHKGTLPVPCVTADKSTDPTAAKTVCWALIRNGVVDFNFPGQLWPYLPDLEARKATLWCPADDAEFQANAGTKPDPERTMSYSFNSNVRPAQGSRVTILLREVKDPGNSIYIWEEVGPTTLGV